MSKGASHQKSNRPVTFQISEEVYLVLKNAAKQEDRSVSNMIRKVIQETFFTQGASHPTV
jgi:hypothetical protein